MVDIYPWQQTQWQRLTSALRVGHLGHALLFSGRAGVGQDIFAGQFAKLLMCENPEANHEYCGGCRGCSLFDAESHPDFTMITPAEEGKAIGVDQIRALGEFYALKSHYGGRKVALIGAAETMNRAAGNALLKTLEEPPAGAVIILVTEQYDALSMTIRSRCQRTAFEHVDQKLAANWLAEKLASGVDDSKTLLATTGGAPLMALRYAEDDGLETQQSILRCWADVLSGERNPMTASREFEGLPASRLIEQLAQIIYLLIVQKIDPSSAPPTTQAGLNRYLQACINGLNFSDLYAILDVVLDAKRQLRGPTNPRDADLLDPIWLMLGDYARPSA